MRIEPAALSTQTLERLCASHDRRTRARMPYPHAHRFSSYLPSSTSDAQLEVVRPPWPGDEPTNSAARHATIAHAGLEAPVTGRPIAPAGNGFGQTQALGPTDKPVEPTVAGDGGHP
jgi:hypothetical protein